MSDAIQSSDSGLQQTVESLMKARPDLMDPTKLQLFEELLKSYVVTHKSSPEQAPERLTNSPSRFMAFVMNLCGGYFAVMSVILIFPTVPLAVLPFFAVIGFFCFRYLASRTDKGRARTLMSQARPPKPKARGDPTSR